MAHQGPCCCTSSTPQQAPAQRCEGERVSNTAICTNATHSTELWKARARPPHLVILGGQTSFTGHVDDEADLALKGAKGDLRRTREGWCASTGTEVVKMTRLQTRSRHLRNTPLSLSLFAHLLAIDVVGREIVHGVRHGAGGRAERARRDADDEARGGSTGAAARSRDALQGLTCACNSH